MVKAKQAPFQTFIFMKKVEDRLYSNPQLSQAQALLKSCALPWEDLTPNLLANFKGYYENSHLVGIIGLEQFGSIGLLRSLAIHPQQRKQGIARVLINSLEKEAIERNIESLYLLTTTAETLFTHFGYKTIDRSIAPNEIKSTSEFSTLCPHNAILMFKQL